MFKFPTWYILKNKKVPAVTLIELLISITIIALLSSILLINSDSIASYKEKIELDKFITTINQCKRKSIKERRIYEVRLLIQDNAYSSSLNNEIDKFDYLSFSDYGTNLESIAFTVRGIPSKGSAGTIVINGRKKEYKITINPVTGKINIKREDIYGE